MSDRAVSTVHCRAPRATADTPLRTLPADALDGYATDAARFPGGGAAAVHVPADEAQVAAVLARAARVLVIGAQSSLTGGATPFGDVVVSTADLHDLEFPRADRVRVGAGVVHAVLARELAVRGGAYPAVPTYDGATVGGTVATNAAGAATFKYGATRPWVRALTVVLANGDVLDLERGQVTASPDGRFAIVATDGARREVVVPAYRLPPVPKLAAGYYAAPGMDLVDLFIGAEGTLGVVTAVELAVVTTPPAPLVGLVPVADDATALVLADELRAAGERTRRDADPRGIDVAAVEYLDAASLALVRADGVDLRLGVPLPATAGAALLFQVDLPPGTSGAAAADAIARADDPTADGPLARLCRLLARHGVLAATVPALPDDTARREALFALREAVPEAVNRRVADAQRTIDAGISKSGGDPIVPTAHIGELLTRARGILDALELAHATWGHLSDGNLHPNVLPRRAADRERAARAQLSIGSAAIELGGSPLSEHGVGRNPVKQELLRRLYGDGGIAAMRRVKQALDPRGVLAPGVIFPAAPV